MKKTFLRSALLTITGIGLMVGTASALTLDVGTMMEAIDTNLDNDVLVSLDGSSQSPWDIEYSIDGLIWNSLNSPIQLDAGTIFDLAIYDGSNRYTLSGDANNGAYSVIMDFSNEIDGTFADPLRNNPYYGNVSIMWTIGSAPLGSQTTTFSIATGDGVAPVPEPATMLLFGTGLAGLAVIRRKKSQKA